ncbi:MAG: L-rhamnose mutarotase [Actinomycetota bacterium]|mgnify:CR=1 FL=1
MAVKRIGSVIGINEVDIAEYERIHREVWPEVLATLKRVNVQNYSIFRYGLLLFSYMEYTGNNYEADMALVESDPTTQEWWKITAPLQKQVPEVIGDEWWHTIPEVFHMG